MHGTSTTTNEMIARTRDARYATAARNAIRGTDEHHPRRSRFTLRRRGDRLES